MTRAKIPVDLRPPSSDPWETISVPAGWEPVARICRGVAEDGDRVTEHVVRCIEDEIPAYRALGTVPGTDLRSSVRRNLEMMFFGLAEHRRPSADELRIRRELGHRRAMQGHPVDALLQAYHVGYRELWLELVDQAKQDGSAAQAQMLTAATTFWGWIQEITNAVADAYDETARGRETLAAGTRQRFVDLTVSGDLDSEELTELTTTLGFSAEGIFRATVARPEGLEGSELMRLQRELRGARGIHQCIVRGHEIVLLSQDAFLDQIRTAIGRVLPQDTAVGVGVARPGLAGARLSLADAERALALALRRKRTVLFEDEWLPALIVRSQQQLQALLSPGLEVARRQPHLSETVRAFAEAGFSVSETARRLSLHPNSVTYRLGRWQQLTGWDPRSFSGLSNSIAALEVDLSLRTSPQISEL